MNFSVGGSECKDTAMSHSRILVHSLVITLWLPVGNSTSNTWKENRGGDLMKFALDQLDSVTLNYIRRNEDLFFYFLMTHI